jgi:hypothetical protein
MDFAIRTVVFELRRRGKFVSRETGCVAGENVGLRVRWAVLLKG